MGETTGDVRRSQTIAEIVAAQVDDDLKKRALISNVEQAATNPDHLIGLAKSIALFAELAKHPEQPAAITESDAEAIDIICGLAFLTNRAKEMSEYEMQLGALEQIYGQLLVLRKYKLAEQLLDIIAVLSSKGRLQE